ncbi:hypothetical protein M3690_04130 [Priestia megaterium]|uniref:hypothetical protein n=1 Tax=Priestia megaterium TaxID=1404 RepID=UPI00203BC719|nr:hypothetical protein [Priestia megaterium]MCM3792479.1 hypothetical protein [Priestia megaterium]
MSEIKCLVCRSTYFNQIEADIDVEVDVYSTAYTDVSSYTSNNEDHISVDVNTRIHNDTSASGELSYRVYPEDRQRHFSHKYTDIYQYACERCGYIMNFTKVKKVENKYQEKQRKQKEQEIDWTKFGK